MPAVKYTTLIRSAACLSALLWGPTLLSAQPDTGALPAFDLVKHDENHKGLWRHTAATPRLQVRWRLDRRVRDVRAVFPHPVLPGRIVVTTEGLPFLSDDAGSTWQPLTAARDADSVRYVAFQPAATGVVYLASDTQGIWHTADDGRTFTQVASQKKGLAANETVQVCTYPADRRGLTLIVAHGELTPGISVSDDGGASWRVLAQQYHVHHVLPDAGGGMRLFFVASRIETPDARSIYACQAELATVGPDFLRKLFQNGFQNYSFDLG